MVIEQQGPVLVLGATGTTGSRITARLRVESHPVRAVSRSSTPAFDWADPDTHDAVLAGVRSVFLLPPVAATDPAPVMTRFVDRARAAGVVRFVLLSASVIPEGAAGVGQVHAHLRRVAPEWTVLRPSWFMQNFQPGHGHYMADDAPNGRLATSVADGRVAFVDADDIAAVAVRALVDPHPPQGGQVLTGPAALSYDDVAHVLSQVLQRPVTHVRVGLDDVRRRIVASGVPPSFAGVLADLEVLLREGAEDRVSDAVERITGRPPRSFADWARTTLEPLTRPEQEAQLT